MKVEVHKVVTISHDEASLCAQNAQNARGAEGNKVFPGFTHDTVPIPFQLRREKTEEPFDWPLFKS